MCHGQKSPFASVMRTLGSLDNLYRVSTDGTDASSLDLSTNEGLGGYIPAVELNGSVVPLVDTSAHTSGVQTKLALLKLEATKAEARCELVCQ